MDDLQPPTELALVGHEERMAAIDRIGRAIDSRRRELDEHCRLPADLHASAVADGLFDMLTPMVEQRDHLGTWFASTIRAAWWNGSFGWLVGQGSGAVGYASAANPAWLARVRCEVDAPVLSATNVGMLTLERHGNEWSASGTIAFASGCLGATHILGVGCEEGGEPSPETLRFVCAPASSWNIVEDWDAVGLRGTGSHAIEARSLRVPEEDTMLIFADPPARGPERIFGVSVAGAFPAAYSVAATQLGVARRALDETYRIAATKVAAGSIENLDNSETVRSTLMRLDGLWHQAAKACEGALAELWSVAVAGRDPSDRQRAVQATIAHLANMRAREIVEECWGVVGTSALNPDHPIARSVADVHALFGHVAVSEAVLVAAAARLRGDPNASPVV